MGVVRYLLITYHGQKEVITELKDMQFNELIEIDTHPMLNSIGGSFLIRIRTLDITENLYVGAEGTFIEYLGKKWETEQDYYQLMDLLEKEKIQKMLEKL